ncbi:hypothetical protein NXS19_010570, partial [Fusarium pseudograminearum]
MLVLAAKGSSLYQRKDASTLDRQCYHWYRPGHQLVTSKMGGDIDQPLSRAGHSSGRMQKQ